MAVYRQFTKMILERLARGPARPCEIVEELYAEPPDVTNALITLYRKGRIHRTRIVLTGRHGGNVAVIYQLLR